MDSDQTRPPGDGGRRDEPARAVTQVQMQPLAPGRAVGKPDVDIVRAHRRDK